MRFFREKRESPTPIVPAIEDEEDDGRLGVLEEVLRADGGCESERREDELEKKVEGPREAGGKK